MKAYNRKKKTKHKSKLRYNEIYDYKLMLDRINKEYKVSEFYTLDEYFMYDHGKDAILHFEIEGLSGIKFGVWLNGKPVIFAEFKELIDKFKPSACIEFENIKEMFRFIKKAKENYKREFVRSWTDVVDVGTYEEEFNGYWIEEYNKRIELKKNANHLLDKLCEMSKEKSVKFFILDTNYKSDWISIPRFLIDFDFVERNNFKCDDMLNLIRDIKDNIVAKSNWGTFRHTFQSRCIRRKYTNIVISGGVIKYEGDYSLADYYIS